MNEYRKYLATKVLNEDAIINYRQLSRVLKVHTHLAKQMLYDFHHTQNAKKSGTVHATYYIAGILRSEKEQIAKPNHEPVSQPDEDTPMESSPFPSSYPEPDPVPSFESDDAEPTEEPVQNTTVLLVREEELEESKADFDEIHSIFVYSLEPGPLKDFQLLAQCNRDVTTEFWAEDPLKAYPKYGLITNKDVRRRTGTRPPPNATPASAPAPVSANAKPQAATSAPQIKAENSAKSTTNVKPANIKRQSSDLFKSFAKSKPPKLKSTDSNATSASGSLNPSPVDKEDEEMLGMSEDEPPSDIDEAAMAAEAERADAARKARKEKEERLKQMMDDDDDVEMADSTAVAEELPPEALDDSAALDRPKEPEKKEEVTVSGGRRRGRRKVMKKRTYQDEDGYLVTKEEAVWESFSEEEPEQRKPKVNVAAPHAAKKSATVPKGQGNLMNFFKKK
ncbi:uncharacterized protein PV09_06655 [Verruconis gallopava]|uniref:DNA polymerase delta subunit 3 n=1 Tax=Verruconis gallopava TaxID=253628 RepID=A0A0D2ARH7_9PEZI|nr:uncharacterized protein PV09_06655 [Verruconis gallopava]KIW01799.1 hypothetical protein PV09_06655 [Verruconis gallopava]